MKTFYIFSIVNIGKYLGKIEAPNCWTASDIFSKENNVSYEEIIAHTYKEMGWALPNGVR